MSATGEGAIRLRPVIRYFEPGKRTVLLVGAYVADPNQPAGIGWCEAIVTPYKGDVGRHCYTYARSDRDGRRVCGLHLRAKRARYGPVQQADEP